MASNDGEEETGGAASEGEIEKFRKRTRDTYTQLEVSTHDNNVGSKTVTRK